MNPRRRSAKLGSSTFMAATVFAVGLHAAAPGAYAEETAATEAKSDFIPGADGTTNRPPATFFTINQVLAKLDRQRGKGAGATRLAALDAVQCRDRRVPALIDAPPAGKAPFGSSPSVRPRGSCGTSGAAWKLISPRNTRSSSNAEPILRPARQCRAVSAADQRRQGEVRPRPAG